MQLEFASVKDCLTLLCNTTSDTLTMLKNKFSSMLEMALCIYIAFLQLPHRYPPRDFAYEYKTAPVLFYY